MIELNTKVRKKTGYEFEGFVVSSFSTIAGKDRVVVDNGDGLLHIFNEDQLEIVTDDVAEKIREITYSLNSLLQEKNKRYGNSALEPLEGIKYSPEEGIKIRLCDKLKRIINSDELRKNDIADVLGYLVLLCVNKGFINFNDLID